jgi:hypothetical protein
VVEVLVVDVAVVKGLVVDVTAATGHAQVQPVIGVQAAPMADTEPGSTAIEWAPALTDVKATLQKPPGEGLPSGCFLCQQLGTSVEHPHLD